MRHMVQGPDTRGTVPDSSTQEFALDVCCSMLLVEGTVQVFRKPENSTSPFKISQKKSH